MSRRLRIIALLTIVAAAFSRPMSLKAASVPECIEGGLGQSTCQVSACNVTCGAGYYACCTIESCSCVYSGDE